METRTESLPNQAFGHTRPRIGDIPMSNNMSRCMLYLNMCMLFIPFANLPFSPLLTHLQEKWSGRKVPPFLYSVTGLEHVSYSSLLPSASAWDTPDNPVEKQDTGSLIIHPFGLFVPFQGHHGHNHLRRRLCGRHGNP